MTGRHILVAMMMTASAAGLGLAGALNAQETGAMAGGDATAEMPMDGFMGGMDFHSMMGGMGGMMGGAAGGMGGMMGGAGFDFAAVDSDGDGKLTEAEIRAHRQAGIAGLDADGDGLISAAELSAQMMQRMQARAEAMAAARVARSDFDGDGKLSAAELLSPPMAGRMLSRIDADGDGAITEAEIAEARAAMLARHGDGKARSRGGRMGQRGDGPGRSGDRWHGQGHMHGQMGGGHHPWFGMTDGDDDQN